MAGGKYLQQKPQKGGGKNTPKREVPQKKAVNNHNFHSYDGVHDYQGYDMPQNNKKGGPKKGLLIALIAVLVLIIGLAIGGIIYYNTVLNMMSRPDDVTVETLSEEEINELLGLNITEPVVEEASTSPEETWPEIVSDKNITYCRRSFLK